MGCDSGVVLRNLFFIKKGLSSFDCNRLGRSCAQ